MAECFPGSFPITKSAILAVRPSSPKRPIQGQVRDGFGNRFRFHGRRALQVRNRASYLQDSVVGAGCQTLLVHAELV
jgi:hypothetical protein